MELNTYARQCWLSARPGLGRVGEGSALWINGDYKQVDDAVFVRNSGLIRAVERLKGHPRFGYVKLLKTERSETAAMADLLDE